MFFVHDVYGANVNKCQAGRDKMLASYWPLAVNVPARAVHTLSLIQ